MEKIAVIGIGKLGLCFALQLEKAGFNVLGIDTNIAHVEAINNKSLQSPEPGVDEALRSSVNFWASHSIETLSAFNATVIFIAVATPAIRHGGYDHSIVDSVLDSLNNLEKPSLRKELIILCTTLPGYCDSKALVAQAKNYFLSYHPEFIAQGSIMHDLQHRDQILIGEADSVSGDRIVEICEKMSLTPPSICRMNLLSAEIAKLATNCFLTMKISFANAIGDLAEITGAQTEKIVAAIGSDSRIGNKFLRYGFGFGGPCFPRDNRALNFFAEKRGYELLLAKATDEVNTNHLQFQLKQYLDKYPETEAIHFYSVAYKAGTTITEESQKLELAVSLIKKGRKVIIHDCQEVICNLQKQFGNLFEYVIIDYSCTGI